VPDPALAGDMAAEATDEASQPNRFANGAKGEKRLVSVKKNPLIA
jgi:hypothetical protein